MSTSSPGFGVPLHLASPYRGRGRALRIVRNLAAVQHTAGPIEGPPTPAVVLREIGVVIAAALALELIVTSAIHSTGLG